MDSIMRSKIILLFIFFINISFALNNKVDNPEDFDWYDGSHFGVLNQGWRDVENTYDRLPLKAKNILKPNYWTLSKMSAGLAVRFKTNSSQLAIKWEVGSKNLSMYHMPSTGVSGIDVYSRDEDGKLKCVLVGSPAYPERIITLNNRLGYDREYMIYFPLYNSLKKFSVGLRKDSSIKLFPTHHESGLKPLVVFGPSDTQGCCASRAGMTDSAILGRVFNREVINLGFSGQIGMEPETMELVSELDPEVFILEQRKVRDSEVLKKGVEILALP